MKKRSFRDNLVYGKKRFAMWMANALKKDSPYVEVATRLVKWVSFGIVLAVVPLLIDLNHLRYEHQGVADWHEVIQRGQLMIVTAGIGGAAIGELVGSGKQWLAAKFVSGIICLLFICLSADAYGFVSQHLRTPTPGYNVGKVVSDSVCWFWWTVASSCGCVLLAKEQ